MKKYILFPLLVIVAFLAAAPATHASMRYRSSYSQQYNYGSYGCNCDYRTVNYGYMPYSVGPYMNSGYNSYYDQYSYSGYQQPYYYGNSEYYNNSRYYGNTSSFGGALIGGFIGSFVGSQYGNNNDYYYQQYY